MPRRQRFRSPALVGCLVCLWSVFPWAPLPAQVFITDKGHGDVRLFDSETGDLIGSFGETAEILSFPHGLALHPVTRHLFVGGNGGRNAPVQVFDGETGASLGPFGETGESLFFPTELAFDPVSQDLFVVDYSVTNHDIRRFDSVTGAFLGSFGETADNLSLPKSLTFHTETGNLFVLEEIESVVKEFDGETGAFIGEFGETGPKLVRPNSIEFNGTTGELIASERTANPFELTGGLFRFDGTSGAFLGSMLFTLKDPLGLTWVPGDGVAVGDRFYAVSADPVSAICASAESLFLETFIGAQEDHLQRPQDIAVRSRAGGTTPSMPASMANTASAGDTGHPISTLTGELFDRLPPDVDLGGPLAVRFSRYYGSLLARNGLESSLGPNWRHSFEWSMTRDGGTAEIVTSRGRRIPFEKDGDAWRQTDKLDYPFEVIASGPELVLVNPRTQLLRTFDADGRLSKIEDGRGNALELTYEGNELREVADGLGRVLTFTYEGDRLTELTDGTRTLSFGYTGGVLLSSTDALGAVTTYAYDTESGTAGLMTAMTRPEGNTPLTQTFDDDGRAVTQTDALGDALALEFEEATTMVTDALGNTTIDTHDGDGRLTSIQDAGGETMACGYDDGGRRSGITDRLGGVTTFAFDGDTGLRTSVTQASGATTSFEYADRTVSVGESELALSDVTRVDLPDETSVSFAYDDRGNLTTLSDGAGGEWTATHNERGQVLTRTNAAGGTTTLAYNDDGTLASREDPFGNVTTFEYDGLRRVTAVVNPDGSRRSYTYDDADRLITGTDELGETQTFEYDQNGKVVRWIDASGEVTEFAYDAVDRLIRVTDRIGNSVSATYDARGRLETMANESGSTVSFGYDERGRLVSLTDGAGRVWGSTYDAEGAVVSSTNPAGDSRTFTSDEMGRITRAVDPMGDAREVTYDSMGRIASVSDELGSTTIFSYESHGRLAGIALPSGAAASYERDALARTTKVIDPKGSEWELEYDGAGRLTAEIDPLGGRKTSEYDSRGRVSKITFPGEPGAVELTYDAASRLRKLAFTDGTVIDHGYDAGGRLVSATGVALQRDAEGRITESGGLAIGRDDRGRIARVTFPPGDVVYRYDSRDLLVELEDWSGGRTRFEYDDAGRLVSAGRPNGVSTLYTRDANGRTSTIEEKSGDTSLALTELERNGRGDVTRATRRRPVDPVLDAGSRQYDFDAASQVESFRYDADGRLLADGVRSYTWDLASRVTSITENGSTVSFEYDAFGHRTSRTEEDVTTSFVWNYALDLPSISIERVGNTDLRYYIHTPTGVLLYSIEADDGRRRFFHFDESGNTVLLTDDAGGVVAACAYGPYGELLAETGDSDNRFTYGGAFGVEREGDGGLYYMRSRYYDSETAGFISRDPIRSLAPRRVNPYQYAGGNPLSFVDPDGRARRSARDLTLIDNQNRFFLPHEVAHYVRFATLDLARGGFVDRGPASLSSGTLLGVSLDAVVPPAPQSEREAPLKLSEIAFPDEDDGERDSPFSAIRGEGSSTFLLFAMLDVLGLQQVPEGLEFDTSQIADEELERSLARQRAIDRATAAVPTPADREARRQAEQQDTQEREADIEAIRQSYAEDRAGDRRFQRLFRAYRQRDRQELEELQDAGLFESLRVFGTLMAIEGIREGR